jgi:hypothetical protein
MNLYRRDRLQKITQEAYLSLVRDFFSDAYISQFMKAPEKDILAANDTIFKYYL